MLAFVVEVVVVSIAVSLVAGWIHLIPRYPKLRYAFLVQVFNAVFLTVVLTVLFAVKVYPSWVLMFLLVLLILWLSVECTNYLVRRSGAEPTP